MNTITLTLCASTRTGCLSAPIHSCADERLTLAGDLTLSDGTSVALLTPRGNTLAHTILSEECAPGATIPLSTLTAQAAEYTRSCRAGDTREALLAIGESEHPLALIPARISQNPLYTLAPPTDLAPAYPTTETLKSLLAEMQAASNAAAQSETAAETAKADAQSAAAQAASRAAFALAAKTEAQSAATVAQTAQGKAESAKTDAEDAKTDAASSANAAAASELKALAYKNAAEASVEAAGSYSQQAIDSAKKAEQLANTAATHALKAASSASKAANSATDAETAKAYAQEAAAQSASRAGFALAAKTEAQSAATVAQTAQGKAEAAQTAAQASAEAAETAKEAAAFSATAAANSASAAKASETAAANSATAASSSATAAEDAKTGAEAAKTAAETDKTLADAAKAAAASSATAAANSAAAAAGSAADAASQVTDTLKRINFCNGKFYSQYYNAGSRSITWNEKIGDACLMAWNDRYIIITTSQKVGWIVVNGSDFSFISSSPYHHSAHLYNHSTFSSLGFNGSRVAIFYRFGEYKEGGNNCNYAEVLDANTGEVLIEKTYTAEEMAFIKAAPCFKLEFTCILKNGDMIHRGTIFSGEDLSIKGYVAAEEGFAVVSAGYSTYCCYLTANAGNSYSGEDPIIVQSNDTYSFWVDDRYTLGEDGEPIVTLRNFHVDGIFSETNSNTRKVAALFSKNTRGYGEVNNRAIVRNPSTGKLAAYSVALDETQENRIVFTKSGDIDYTNRLRDFIPVNFYDSSLIYNNVPFYCIAGALIYAVSGTGSIAKSPCIALQAYDNTNRWDGPYYLPSVAYTNAYGKHSRPLPISRFFYNNSSLIYPVENI